MLTLPLEYNKQYITKDGKIVGPFDPDQTTYFDNHTRVFAIVEGRWRGWVKETGKRVYTGYVGGIISDDYKATEEEMYKAVMG